MLDTVVVYTEPILPQDLLERVKKAEILWVGLSHDISATVIGRAKKLRIIVSPTTGLDHIDLAECKKRGVTILSLVGEREFLNTVWATAEHTVGLILSLLRGIPHAVQHTMEGGWDRTRFVGTELRGKMVGIVGFGRVGKQVFNLLIHFGCRFLFAEVPGRVNPESRFPLTDVLEGSDIVLLHTADQDFNTIEFEQMKKGSYFINTARGRRVSETALLDALKCGHLAGAALDVIRGEYMPDQWRKWDALQDYARLCPHKLILTPHIGGYTKESLRSTERFMQLKLKRYLRGEAQTGEGEPKGHPQAPQKDVTQDFTQDEEG